MSQIYRDAYGVPHIRGDSVLDVARGHGAATAVDRSWQLEWLRLRATGTTASVFGDAGRAWDDFAARTQVVDTAQRAFDRLSEESQAFVAAYVEGLNGRLHGAAVEFADLGHEPEPWTDWMPLANFHAQHILFANAGNQVWKRHADAVLGPDAALISHEGPTLSGSNAWAVGGQRTASGRPLIGGDPHRSFESPGGYQQVRLASEDPEDPFDVLGLAFVGVPGIPHFAHAGEVAWAITNGAADYQEAGADGSFRNASTVLGDLGFEALLPLLRARSADDVDAAFDHWVEPVNNVVIADRTGAVRYRIAGRVPTRDPADPTRWTGWLADAHREDVAPDGQVITANERRGPQSDQIGSTFAPPYRAQRIADLLRDRRGLSTDDFAAIHRDTWLAVVPLIRGLVPGAFDDFDGHMDADSAQAASFAAWRSALVRRIAAEPALAGLHEAPDVDPVFRAWLDVTQRIALALPSLVAAGRPFGIDLPALAAAALEDSRDHTGTWGDTHVFDPTHAFDLMGLRPPEVPRVRLSGDNDTVMAAGSLPGQSDACFRGAVARYVWDLEDRTAGGWVVPLGASGDPGHPHHHDQTASWAVGELLPIVTAWGQLRLE
ncbi:hypothetical protein GCM10027020_14140 [Nocardioides salsibiostraticola]